MKENMEKLRMNSKITATELRVILEGKPPAVMQRQEALELASSLGLDLIEVSPDQNPPVCKIMDFGKFKFQQQKSHKPQKTVQIKEVKFRPNIAENDLNVKVDQIKKFLKSGSKVKISLNFKGREIVHNAIGMSVVNNVITKVGECIVDNPPKLEGKVIYAIVSPKRGTK